MNDWIFNDDGFSGKRESTEARVMHYLAEGYTVREAVIKAKISPKVRDLYIEKFEKLWSKRG